MLARLCMNSIGNFSLLNCKCLLITTRKLETKASMFVPTRMNFVKLRKLLAIDYNRFTASWCKLHK